MWDAWNESSYDLFAPLLHSHPRLFYHAAAKHCRDCGGWSRLQRCLVAQPRYFVAKPGQASRDMIRGGNSDFLRLAKEGLVLEQSYVQPICTPTRCTTFRSSRSSQGRLWWAVGIRFTPGGSIVFFGRRNLEGCTLQLLSCQGNPVLIRCYICWTARSMERSYLSPRWPKLPQFFFLGEFSHNIFML